MNLSLPTDTNLSKTEILIGLLEHGLFAEKLPPCFTSKGLIAAIGTSLDFLLSESDPQKLKKALDKRTHDFARYSVLRDINVPRQFGIPHPEGYAIQCLFIREHWNEIRKHNSQPTFQVSRVHVRRLGSGKIFMMNYQGMHRFELEEEEIRWAAGSTHVAVADISACFPSIYTHSIPWALHGRTNSKQKRGLLQLSGNVLDKTTQGLRDGQTNGLLIGPHSSNVISEIVLTQVDKRLLNAGYQKLKRYIDDYHYYADSYDDAERFIRELGLALREFELNINEKKTRIQQLPQPIEENWVREINRFSFPADRPVSFSSVRSFLDLALELAEKAGTSSPLNYAFKMLPKNLNPRAKRLLVQEAINLSLLFPYLAPVLGPYIFEQHEYVGIEGPITDFANKLAKQGIKRIYPDAIAHSLYYGIKYDCLLTLTDEEFRQIIELNDCIANVLLLEYATKNRLAGVMKLLKKQANALKVPSLPVGDVDRQWLFVYQMWNEADLRSAGQSFLADLKKQNFCFINRNAFSRTAPSQAGIATSSYSS